MDAKRLKVASQIQYFKEKCWLFWWKIASIKDRHQHPFQLKKMKAYFYYSDIDHTFFKTNKQKKVLFGGIKNVFQENMNHLKCIFFTRHFYYNNLVDFKKVAIEVVEI